MKEVDIIAPTIGISDMDTNVTDSDSTTAPNTDNSTPTSGDMDQSTVPNVPTTVDSSATTSTTTSQLTLKTTTNTKDASGKTGDPSTLTTVTNTDDSGTTAEKQDEMDTDSNPADVQQHESGDSGDSAEDDVKVDGARKRGRKSPAVKRKRRQKNVLKRQFDDIELDADQVVSNVGKFILLKNNPLLNPVPPNTVQPHEKY